MQLSQNPKIAQNQTIVVPTISDKGYLICTKEHTRPYPLISYHKKLWTWSMATAKQDYAWLVFGSGDASTLSLPGRWEKEQEGERSKWNLRG